MAADDSPGLKSLEALIGGSLPENLSKLSSTYDRWLLSETDEIFRGCCRR
ncbi:BnaC01g42500D [Brassica napus]|uniref:BnaC01g42500D protein n=1 Tax=Brassica napus TaxID=3708 RepID=A0A078JAC0_BRANA|nr:BnaC01g42500D [Brassica napus]